MEETVKEIPKKRGWAKAGPGRPKGSVNKASNGVREAAQKYGPEALEALIKIVRTGENENARIAAAKEILDRAYGKSIQQVVGDDEGGPIKLEIQWQWPEPKK